MSFMFNRGREQENEDLREFIREIMQRNERVWQGVIVELREMKDETCKAREQIQADTKAVLAALDCFETSDGQAQA